MFPNSFQPKLIPVPVSRGLPTLSLEYVSQSPWNHCRVSLEWKLCQTPGVSGRKKWCWQKERKCFFNLVPEVSADIVSHVFGDNGTYRWEHVHFPKCLAQRPLASGCRSPSYSPPPPPPTLLSPFLPSRAQQTVATFVLASSSERIPLFCLHMHAEVRTLLPDVNLISSLYVHAFFRGRGLEHESQVTSELHKAKPAFSRLKLTALSERSRCPVDAD